MLTEHLNLTALNGLLQTVHIGKAPGWPNEVWDSIDSTNTRAIDLSKQGAPEGIIVGARRQTAGRGRLGRQWISPENAGLYMSVLLRPKTSPAVARLVGFAAGLAVIEAVSEICGVTAGLKWVNDVVYGGKKLGGILAEMIATGNDKALPPALVVGIGLNLRLPASEIPVEISSSGIWLDQIVQQPVDANQIAASLARSLESRYQQLLAGDSDKIVSSWKKYSVTLGRQIKARSGQTELEGLATDIAPDGALIVELNSGKTISLHAGDVSVRNADGSYA